MTFPETLCVINLLICDMLFPIFGMLLNFPMEHSQNFHSKFHFATFPCCIFFICSYTFMLNKSFVFHVIFTTFSKFGVF